jgi:hypothetical protein
MADYRECKWCGKGFYEDGIIEANEWRTHRLNIF